MNLVNLVRFSLALTVVVILLGAYTRLADAGLGCPDWPGCYGSLSVPSQQDEIALAQTLYPSLVIEADKAWLEMIHRYFAGSLGLFVVCISLVGIVSKRISLAWASMLTGTVLFQAALGMWTVTMKLMPIVVVGHLLGGFTLFTLLALTHWRLSSQIPIEVSSSGLVTTKGLSLIALFLVIIQIALGGWTSSNYAALMCTTLPICEGNWQSYLNFGQAFQLIQPPSETYEFGTLDYSSRMTIHVVHRIGAFVVSLSILLLVWSLWKRRETQLKNMAQFLFIVLIIQLSFGVANVVFSLPMVIAVAHNFGAAVLLLVVCRTNYLIWVAARPCNYPRCEMEKGANP